MRISGNSDIKSSIPNAKSKSWNIKYQLHILLSIQFNIRFALSHLRGSHNLNMLMFMNL